MKLVTFVTLLAGVVYAGPALQQPLPPSPCPGLATKTKWDDPSSTEEPPCSTPSAISVTFNELAVTYYGEELYLVGNITELGEWNPDSSLHLNSSEYTEEKPLWYIIVDFPVDTAFEYKYIRKEPSGNIKWESDPNRAYVVEGSCDGNATVDDTWR